MVFDLIPWRDVLARSQSRPVCRAAQSRFNLASAAFQSSPNPISAAAFHFLSCSAEFALPIWINSQPNTAVFRRRFALAGFGPDRSNRILVLALQARDPFPQIFAEFREMMSIGVGF
jgi:hypothetical protein